jgi:hypothetical protein
MDYLYKTYVQGCEALYGAVRQVGTIAPRRGPRLGP